MKWVAVALAGILVAAIAWWSLDFFVGKGRTQATLLPAPSAPTSFKNVPLPPKVQLNDSQVLLGKVQKMAPELVERLRISRESYDKGADNGLEKNVEYKLVGTDVQKTDSLINPVVGIVKIGTTHSIRAPGFSGIGSIRSATVVVQIVEQPDGKWKCVRADHKVENDIQFGNHPSTTGEVSDFTWAFDGLMN